MQRTKAKYRDGACEYVFMRYNELAEILGEVIEDLPVLTSSKAELSQRNASVSIAVVCTLVGLLGILIGVPLPFGMSMFGCAIVFGIESIGISMWCNRARRKGREIRLPFNESKALEVTLEQFDVVVSVIKSLERIRLAHQSQMVLFQQKIAELNTEELTHAECTAILFNSAEGKIFLEIDFSPDGSGMCSIRKFDVASEYPEFLTWIKSTRRICREGLAREGGPYL